MSYSTGHNDTSKDWIDQLVWGRDLIDWSDPDISPTSISRALVGPVDYWNDLNLTSKAERIKFECENLASSRDYWHTCSPCGKPYYQHALTLMALLFQGFDIHPTTHDITMVVFNAIGRKHNLVNLIGSQSSAKSSTTAALGTLFVVIDPEKSTTKVANPFDKSSENTLFGDFRTYYRAMMESLPDKTFPNSFEYRDQYIALINHPKMGRIEQLSIRNIGLHKGTKAADKKRKRGVICHAIDEVNEIASAEESYLTILSNLVSQAGFIAITGQNFTNTDGNLGGRLAEPQGIYAYQPNSYEELIQQGQHENYIYRSAFNGITLRLPGHLSPNILAGKTLYDYLFTQRNLETMQSFGEDSVYYLSQVAAFPGVVSSGTCVVSRNTVSSALLNDTAHSKLRVKDNVAFLDPSFSTDGDKPAYFEAEIAQCAVARGDGGTKVQELLLFRTTNPIRIRASIKWDDEWRERVARVAPQALASISPMSDISIEDQIAVQVAENLKLSNISARNFGFDPSLRAEIVKSLVKFVGPECVAIDYAGKPDETTHIAHLRQVAAKCCFNMADQAAFVFADALHTKSMRGPLHTAAMQLARTEYKKTAGKNRLEEKKVTKKRLGVSPDDRDAAAGCVLMARRRGWVQEGIGKVADSKDNKALDIERILEDKLSTGSLPALQY